MPQLARELILGFMAAWLGFVVLNAAARQIGPVFIRFVLRRITEGRAEIEDAENVERVKARCE